MTLYESQRFQQIQTLFINCETGEVMGSFTRHFPEDCDYWIEGENFMHMEFCRLEVTPNENGGLVYLYYLKEPK